MLACTCNPVFCTSNTVTTKQTFNTTLIWFDNYIEVHIVRPIKLVLLHL